MLNEAADVGLRDALARVASQAPVPVGLTERMRSQDYKVQGRHKATAAMTMATVAVVAMGAGAPLALTTVLGPSAAGTTVRLASFSLRLPRGYHTGATSAPECGVLLDYVWPFQPNPASPPAPPDVVSRPRLVVSQPKIATAVDKAGGCVLLAVSWAFNPKTATGPQIFPTLPYTTDLDVDGYHGWVGSVNWAHVPGPHQLWAVPEGGPQPVRQPWPTGTEQVLELTILRGAGKVQDFTVAAKGISQSALVSIVSSGLTPTAAVAGTANTPVARH